MTVVLVLFFFSCGLTFLKCGRSVPRNNNSSNKKQFYSELSSNATLLSKLAYYLRLQRS